MVKTFMALCAVCVATRPQMPKLLKSCTPRPIISDCFGHMMNLDLADMGSLTDSISYPGKVFKWFGVLSDHYTGYFAWRFPSHLERLQRGCVFCAGPFWLFWVSDFFNPRQRERIHGGVVVGVAAALLRKFQSDMHAASKPEGERRRRVQREIEESDSVQDDLYSPDRRPLSLYVGA